MKHLILIGLALLSFNIFADEVKIEINPPRPVVGEVFQAYFRIFTDSDDDPVINFVPNNLEVVGKSNQGISTRTIYANGKLTVTREITLVYDLVSSRAGSSYMRDIAVQAGSRTIRHPSISLTILKEAEVMADVFVMADVPKKTLFLGEGIIVRYYLYSKVPVNNLDVKKYPKLNNFLKRFLQEPERSERVSVDGQVYMRTQIYAAKLFPEKTGDLKVDSLQLSATYPVTRSNDPFGSFGLGRDFKTKTINSESVKIEVRPLPQPAPAHFTGLVGNHEIQLQTGANKLIVNEPLEVKLTVSGVGALENLEAPELIKHPALEEFETNGDLKISDPNMATKVFDYTFLAKENLSIPARDITLSYFDPNSEKYVPTQLKLPEIVVAGGQISPSRKESDPKDQTPKKANAPEEISMPQALIGPVGIEEWQWRGWLPLINLGLAGLALVISLSWIIRMKGTRLFSTRQDIPTVFKKTHFEFGEFIKWITPLIKETGKSPLMIIKNSPLSEDSKVYFTDLLSANDSHEYSSRKSQMAYKYQAFHYKELSKYIERVKNESSS